MRILLFYIAAIGFCFMLREESKDQPRFFEKTEVQADTIHVDTIQVDRAAIVF